MSDPVCVNHPDRKAHRIVPKVGPICDECFRPGGAPGTIPQIRETIARVEETVDTKEETPVAKKETPACTKCGKRIRKDNESGVCLDCRKPGSEPAKKSGRAPGVKPSGLRFAIAIAELAAERDRLQGIIDQLEAM